MVAGALGITAVGVLVALAITWRWVRRSLRVPGRRWHSKVVQFLGPFDGEDALPGAAEFALTQTNVRAAMPACRLVLTDAGVVLAPFNPPWDQRLTIPWSDLRTIEVHEGEQPLVVLVRHDRRWAATTARFDLALLTELRRFGVSEG